MCVCRLVSSSPQNKLSQTVFFLFEGFFFVQYSRFLFQIFVLLLFLPSPISFFFSHATLSTPKVKRFSSSLFSCLQLCTLPSFIFFLRLLVCWLFALVAHAVRCPNLFFFLVTFRKMWLCLSLPFLCFFRVLALFYLTVPLVSVLKIAFVFRSCAAVHPLLDCSLLSWENHSTYVFLLCRTERRFRKLILTLANSITATLYSFATGANLQFDQQCSSVYNDQKATKNEGEHIESTDALFFFVDTTFIISFRQILRADLSLFFSNTTLMQHLSFLLCFAPLA